MADLSNVHRHVAMGDGKEGGSKTKQNFNIKKKLFKKVQMFSASFLLVLLPLICLSSMISEKYVYNVIYKRKN